MGTLSVDKLVKTSSGAAEFTLPATDGTAGQVLQTDGSGQLSVTTVGSSGIAADAITATQIAANAVTSSEIVDDAVTSAKLANTLNITSGNSLTIDSGATITNSGTATGFGGDNTPAFLATSTTQQTVTNDVTTKIEFANSVFDTDSAFDNTTNYRFTVPSGEGGRYSFQVHAVAWNSNNSGMKLAQLYIRVNGSSVLEISHDMRNNFGGGIGLSLPFLLNLSASDYVEIYGMMQATGTCKWYSSATYRTAFSGFKLL